MSNHIYLVVSETLYERIPILDFGQGPDEPYRIVELCVAKSREQARWLAWQTDKSFDSDPRDMPNFRTRKLCPTTAEPSVCTDRDKFSDLWQSPQALSLLATNW